MEQRNIHRWDITNHLYNTGATWNLNGVCFCCRTSYSSCGSVNLMVSQWASFISILSRVESSWANKRVQLLKDPTVLRRTGERIISSLTGNRLPNSDRTHPNIVEEAFHFVSFWLLLDPQRKSNPVLLAPRARQANAQEDLNSVFLVAADTETKILPKYYHNWLSIIYIFFEIPN